MVEAAPDAPYPTELWNDIALPEGFASEGPLLDRWAERMTAGTAEIVEAGRGVTARRVPRRAGAAARLHPHAGRSSSSGYDVLLTPSMPLPAFGTDVAAPGGDRRHAGRPVLRRLVRAGAAGQPDRLPGDRGADRGWTSTGCRSALQVMGPRFGDAISLSLAAAFERVLPGLFPPDLPPGGG